jgi:hypothetical protein
LLFVISQQFKIFSSQKIVRIPTFKVGQIQKKTQGMQLSNLKKITTNPLSKFESIFEIAKEVLFLTQEEFEEIAFIILTWEEATLAKKHRSGLRSAS